ncbi:single-stranded DNA-binding protein [Cellulomonas sp. DKR-3]|uniref:Single-stranded DNA-binding protein n=1 Tax=Cellulomonas fulva TaxID=2835530 RepID=A0ABS5U2K8_9CELL|nr:single-stranded DNA-binding protein [Cellulomonas fulva]MBT0995629.1 single-stranded DNA-binding protein [Cellulomonas fulva]
MSNGTLDITVTGLVGSDVTTLPAQDGRAAYTTFRLGSTRRWWNRATGAWQDSQTEWFQVKAWRALAVNVGLSLRKGVPVVVQGRLSTREWQDAGGALRTSLVLEATSVGIDLSYGTVGQFQRTLSGAAAQSPQEERAERPPVDLSALTAVDGVHEDERGGEDEGLVEAGDVLADDRAPGEDGFDEYDDDLEEAGAGVLAASRA